MPKTVGVAVSNATFHFDKLYTYAVMPDQQNAVKLGSMVLVPFGRGYLKKASVHQAHPHALRHTFATTCLQAHCDIKTLSELLGHSDAAVTLKKYVHSDMKRKRREINRVFENF